MTKTDFWESRRLKSKVGAPQSIDGAVTRVIGEMPNREGSFFHYPSPARHLYTASKEPRRIGPFVHTPGPEDNYDIGQKVNFGEGNPIPPGFVEMTGASHIEPAMTYGNNALEMPYSSRP